MTDYNKQIVELIDDFSFFENWEDKYQYLIDLGRNVPKMDEKLKVDKNKLKGCQSVVYFSNSVNNDGSIRSMDFGGPFVGLGFRFYINFM